VFQKISLLGSWGPGSKQEIAFVNLVHRSLTGKNVPVRLLGTRFEARNCICDPGAQERYRDFFGNYRENAQKTRKRQQTFKLFYHLFSDISLEILSSVTATFGGFLSTSTAIRLRLAVPAAKNQNECNARRSDKSVTANSNVKVNISSACALVVHHAAASRFAQ
jgi:hypothetical protein